MEVITEIMKFKQAYRGNFEVHLTVSALDSIDAFSAWCKGQQCKCARIVLARGKQAEQPMATWRRKGTILPEVLVEAAVQAENLKHAGFTVVRVKVEADPFNDDIPATDDAATQLPSCNYFEHHVKLRREVNASHEVLLSVCIKYSAHMSRNAWRETSGGLEERFVTLRSYRMGRSASEQQLQRLLTALVEAGEQIIETESEYTVYDSNLALDAGWLPHETP